MTAHRALELLRLAGGPAPRWLAPSFGTPAGVALGFFAGWILGSVVLWPLRATPIETATA